LTKPVETQRLKILLDKIVERQDTLREVKTLRKQLREHGSFGRMIGSSPQMRKVYQVVEQAAPTSASVLIWGESGTGKELVAQTIHQLSPRAQMPFVPINCAAIPETLLESEIFGHEKGAFTGAVDRRPGCFELADRGTLFLDEIAEMTPATQVKLLRVLQERKFRRLGGRNEETVDVRVIAATNVNPSEAVKSGKLREDLYYRLTSSRSSCRRCGSARKIFSCWCSRFSRISTSGTTSTSRRSTRPRCGSSSSTTGRATCANCAT
jgi:DNA-binding NtrC family response regulator